MIASQTPTESTASTPKFPSSHFIAPTLLKHILLVTISEIVNTGGAEIAIKSHCIARLSQVCRSWEQVCLPFISQFETLELDDNLNDMKEELERIQSARKGQTKVGGLHLILEEDLDGRELSARNSKWTKMVESILVGELKEITQLHFDIGDEYHDRYSYLQLIWHFPHLEKLFISSQLSPAQDWILMPPVYVPGFPSNLARLDLSLVKIRGWVLPLPNVRVLTLWHVTFLGLLDDERGKRNKSERRRLSRGLETEACKTTRIFLACFPNLKALALDGVGGVGPTALSQPHLASITRLFLGSCSFSTPRKPCVSCPSNAYDQSFLSILVDNLPRQTRIKHLVLAGITKESPRRQIRKLFSPDSYDTEAVANASRGELNVPIIFSELASLQTRSRSKVDGEYQIVSRGEPAKIKQELEKYGVEDVHLKKWSISGEGRTTEWEPQGI